MADTDVSVIIPAYNASQYIGRAVESVKKQTGLTWEIIIVENGSTDDTYDKCLEYANADDRIKVMQSNKGVSNARNKGLDNETYNSCNLRDSLFVRVRYETYPHRKQYKGI